MELNIKINNIDLKFKDNFNIIQVCNINDITIPKFCYHEKLSIAGNCRMCLVEVAGVLKPIASCAMPISNNMSIFTNTKLVKKAREGILEFILLNHPLDCPICDQGGECDLQDQSLIYGSDKGRFYDFKRSVNDKDCGPLIKTLMTRCIHCTRCVRYIEEIAGFKYMGIIGRGGSMEITNFLNKSINSEVSGNVIDLCPVGALTSKPYSFISRPWELVSFNTIDLNDIMHVNIRVDVRDFKILRVLPIFNSNLNEFWISDITRFCYDGYKNDRLISPFLKDNTGSFINKSWLNILFFFKDLKEKRLNFILGDFIDAETAILLKQIAVKTGNYSIKVQGSNTKLIFNNDFRKNYLFSFDINKLDLFNNILFVGLNLRFENPLLNVRIKLLSDKNLLNIFNIGFSFGYNYITYNLGNKVFEFIKILEGRSKLSSLFLSGGKTLIIFGKSWLNLFSNSIAFINIFNKFKKKIEFTFLNNNIGEIMGYEFNLENSVNNFNDISLKKKKEDSLNIIYSLNTGSFFFNDLSIFSIYQGHHNLPNKLLNNFNILLPTVTFLEKNNTYINFFGLIQKTKFILFPPKNSRSDFKILYIIFKFLDINHYTNNSIKNIFLSYNFINTKFYSFFFKFLNLLNFKNVNLVSNLTNIYNSNSITRSSLVMLSCIKKIRKNYTNFI